MRVHRQDVESAFVVRHVELRLKDRLDRIGVRHPAVGRAAEVGKVVDDALDRQLDDAGRLFVEQDLVRIVARHQAAVVEKARVLHLLHRVLAELPRRRAIADRPLADRFGQRVDRPREHVLLGRHVVHRRQVLVNPAVHADLVAAAGEDGRNHLRVQQVADGRDEERRRQLVLVQQPQDPRHAVDGAVLAAGNHFRDQVAGGQLRRRVVDVEAQAHRDARAVGPRGRLQPLAGADVEHLRVDLGERQLRPRLRPRLREQRGTGEQRDSRTHESHENTKTRNQIFFVLSCFRVFRGSVRRCHVSSTPWLRVRK